MNLLALFLSFLKIGVFSFGGGYAMIPLIDHEIVLTHHWLTAKEFVDIIAVAQITPGPIAINAATFVGARIEGVVGAAVATIAVITGPVVIVLVLFRLADRYSDSVVIQGVFSGLRPALIALIAYSAFSIGRSALTGIPTVLVSIAAMAVLLFSKVHPLIVIAASAAVGILLLRA